MVAEREVKGLGLPAQAAAVAAKEAAGLLSALLAPCAAAGRCSQKEVESLALSLAKACFEAFKAGATEPEKEAFGSIKQPSVPTLPSRSSALAAGRGGESRREQGCSGSLGSGRAGAPGWEAFPGFSSKG